MTYRLTLIALLLFTAIEGLKGAEFRVSNEIVFAQLDTSQVALPRYGFGYVAAFPASRTSLRLFASSGRLIYQNELKDREGVQLKIIDVAIAPSGRVAVEATAVRTDGKTEAVMAFLDPSGLITHLVKHDDFIPLRLRFRGEDDLWALGFSKATQVGHQSGHVVRVYDSKGKKIKDLLPAADFPSIRNLSVDGILVAAQSGIGVYLARANSLYVYASYNDEPVKHLNLPIPSEMEVVTAALLHGNELFFQGLTSVSGFSDKTVAPRAFQLDLSNYGSGIRMVDGNSQNSHAIIGVSEGQLVRIHGARLFVGFFDR